MPHHHHQVEQKTEFISKSINHWNKVFCGDAPRPIIIKNNTKEAPVYWHLENQWIALFALLSINTLLTGFFC